MIFDDVVCINCGSTLHKAGSDWMIGLKRPIEATVSTSPTGDKRCPSCNAGMGSDDVLCINCGWRREAAESGTVGSVTAGPTRRRRIRILPALLGASVVIVGIAVMLRNEREWSDGAPRETTTDRADTEDGKETQHTALEAEGHAGLSIGELYEEAKKGDTEARDAYIQGMLRMSRSEDAAEAALGAECLGELYLFGEIVPRDLEKARKWCMRAAEAGRADAQYNLGVMFRDGTEVAQDFARAAQFFQQAAKAGNIGAQHNLGVMYIEGHGVARDPVKAGQFFLQAAQAGNIDAQHSLGLMYIEGHGVARDPVKAGQFFLQAARAGHIGAQHNLGLMYSEGTGTRRDYGKARFWYEKAASQGYTSSQHNLGLMFIFAHGVRQNLTTAEQWFQRELEAGNESGRNGLLFLSQVKLFYSYDDVERKNPECDWYVNRRRYAQPAWGINYEIVRDDGGFVTSNWVANGKYDDPSPSLASELRSAR
ncbi:MAG: sel1 repeat family protein [Lentisphaerae bacterium]|nr:sel1 repeat family protein [Lentisphaerota bacterium]